MIVKAGPAGDYYNPPTIDGSRPGVFYAKVTGSRERFAMPTLAYHEAVPGHHFQIAAAYVCDRLSTLGTLEVGKFADVLVVQGDPLQDLQVLAKVWLVVHRGMIIREE